MAENIELAIAWRDEQIDLLKSELRTTQRLLEIANDRAEAAEAALYNLREEIEDARS